jgi:hypothetical protein
LIVATGRLNWKSVSVSTVLGAATGGVGSIARAIAVNGTITVSQAVGRTALANAALSGAGSAADSSVNGDTPDLMKMGVASALGGVTSFGMGKWTTSKALNLEKLDSSSVTSPEGLGVHIASTTYSAERASLSQSSVSVAAEKTADVVVSTVQKHIEDKIDKSE